MVPGSFLQAEDIRLDDGWFVGWSGWTCFLKSPQHTSRAVMRGDGASGFRNFRAHYLATIATPRYVVIDASGASEFVARRHATATLAANNVSRGWIISS